MTSAIDKWRQVRLKVWGEYACFTRPEMKVERVSYDVMTPSAARGVLEAVLWKPAIRWIVEQIDVLAPIRRGRADNSRDNWSALEADPRPIRFTSVRRNEVGCVFSNKEGIFVEDNRQQRAGLVLQDVAYLIQARFEMTRAARTGRQRGEVLQHVPPPGRKGPVLSQALPGLPGVSGLL